MDAFRRMNAALHHAKMKQTELDARGEFRCEELEEVSWVYKKGYCLSHSTPVVSIMEEKLLADDSCFSNKKE